MKSWYTGKQITLIRLFLKSKAMADNESFERYYENYFFDIVETALCILVFNQPTSDKALQNCLYVCNIYFSKKDFNYLMAKLT